MLTGRVIVERNGKQIHFQKDENMKRIQVIKRIENGKILIRVQLCQLNSGQIAFTFGAAQIKRVFANFLQQGKLSI